MNDYIKQGWVRFYRKSMTSSVWENPIIWYVWSWCLMKANHEEHYFPFNGKDQLIIKGQFITGRNMAIKELRKVSPQQWRTAINYLKSTSRITIESTNKYSMITILKWNEYQQDNRLTNQPLTNQQPTNNQQITTYKNDKKEKNDKNVAKTSFALKVKNKKMKTYNENESYEEPVLDDDTREIVNKKPQTKKYPNALKVFNLFGKHPLNWKINKTQLQSAENLFTERGMEQIIKALAFIKENKDNEFCPTINSPYDLDSKWAKIIGFKKRQ